MASQYFGVGLAGPKNPINVGSVMRSVACFDGSFLAVSGRRFKRVPSDPGDNYKRIPVFNVDDLHSVIPHDCVPIAVDLVPGAKRLETFVHPPRAFYVFGPEDGTLGARTLSWCRDTIVIPSGCLNLAMAVTVVLYDRTAKLLREEAIKAAPGERVRTLKVV
jgi:tRNA(Leu) C34 or U34 (ribose-2'-O)-methylase TrmL